MLREPIKLCHKYRTEFIWLHRDPKSINTYIYAIEIDGFWRRFSSSCNMTTRKISFFITLHEILKNDGKKTVCTMGQNFGQKDLS